MTSNDRGIDNAQLWRVQKIIIGIAYRNLRGVKLNLWSKIKFQGVNKFREGRGKNI